MNYSSKASRHRKDSVFSAVILRHFVPFYEIGIIQFDSLFPLNQYNVLRASISQAKWKKKTRKEE